MPAASQPRCGRPVLRWGRRAGLTEPRLAKAEDFFARRGRNVIVVARFVGGFRQTNGIIAGAVAMPWRQYAIRDAIGGALWTALWVIAGAFAGDNLGVVRRYQAQVLVAAAVLASVSFVVYALRRRRARSR